MGFALSRSLILCILVASCSADARKSTPDQTMDPSIVHQEETPPLLLPFAQSIGAIPVPNGFSRQLSSYGSFSLFLRTTALKSEGSPVLLYSGDEKANTGVHYAVLDLPIGKRDLHQCADAVMRLRADYLRAQKQYEALHFNFTNGFNCRYDEWLKGKPVKVSGNQVSWYNSSATPGDSDASYWKYLEMVWSYAGTLSLAKELSKRPVDEMEIGDVWIKGGSPGHAVMVVDMARDETGKKLFLLAQSYMPAQEMHILLNPNNEEFSPWYELQTEQLATPEWTFELDQLRSW